MYKEILKSVESIELFPLISLVIFFGFFALLLIWVVRYDKTFLKSMSAMPLDNDEVNIQNQTSVFKKHKL